ncbi:MAG: peptidase M10A and M12B matrixin and adamalysin [Opitutaceae bacterium]|nr:peptidase M10A and M12B matrixin and adamalysin [Opitutaceae bacterium]|tara:strand:+ start:703 stop:1596 length:894 start_codon:yes stop_codon:yes gene_type:complete
MFLAVSAQAQFTFAFDYSYDTNNFFTGSNSGRQTYLESAGTYISNIFSQTSLNAITPTPGAAQPNTWDATFTNPGDGSAQAITNPTYAANVYTIYAGGRALGGSTLGQGGAGGFSASGYGDWFSDIRYRGNGTFNTGWGGSLTFDTATSWYFDSDINTVEAMGSAFDFFSVAIHEIIHVMGFGTTDSWTNLVDNGDPGEFNGTYATALFGSNPTLSSGNGHWAENTQSTVYGSETTQEAAMDPNIAANERKYITALDIAGLRDIGYSAVPEPSTVALIFGISALSLVVIRRRFLLSR